MLREDRGKIKNKANRNRFSCFVNGLQTLQNKEELETEMS